MTVNRNLATEMMVLSTSEQCIPLLQFDATQIAPNRFGHAGNIALSTCHAELQRIIDAVLQTNGHFCKVKARPSHRAPIIVYSPLSASQVTLEQVSYTAPETLDVSLADCWRDVRDVKIASSSVGTWKCQQVFHHACLANSLNRSRLCPCCGNTVLVPRGKMPSGSTTVTRAPRSCEGYDDVATLVIKYNIPTGVQKSYHDNPGTGYQGTLRCAFLPDNAEGCALLTRLTFAFLHGLIFSVGVSQTTGCENSVVWTTIPHKTSLTGGASRFGFPDSSYIDDCNKELDEFNVPKAEVL
jgi:Deltex C-terminal domain